MIMKNFKFLYLLLAAVGVVTFAACTEEWEPGVPDTNAGVYFEDTATVNVAKDSTSADIVVKRTNTAETLEVAVRYEDVSKTGFCTVPASVKFDAGKDTAVLTVGIDTSKMEEGKKYVVNIQLASAEASQYGAYQANFAFMIPERWVDYKGADNKVIPGTLVDDFYPILLGYDAGYSVPVTIMKHEVDPNRIFVVDPFGKKFCENMFGELPGFFTFSEDTIGLEFNISNPEDVRLVNNPADIGVLCAFQDGTYPLSFLLETDEEGNQLPGIVTYNEGVINFAASKVYVGIVDEEGVYPLSPTNASGLLSFILPGVVVTDYSVAVEYTGMYMYPGGDKTEAVFEFAGGLDVESIKYTVVEGDVTKDYSKVVKGIVDGTIEPIYEIKSENELTQSVVLKRGVHTVVAVPYGEKEAVTEDAIAYSFWFNGNGEMPKVEPKLTVGAPADFVAEDKAEEYAKKYPACFNIGLNIECTPSDIKGVKVYVNETTNLNAYMKQNDLKLEDMFEYAEDKSSWLAEAGEAGITSVLNAVCGYEYTILVRLETIYDYSVDLNATYKLEGYDGDFGIGDYEFVDTATVDKKEVKYKETFSVAPGTSYNDFMFVHTSVDESVWYAKYDETAGTFTVTGVEFLYETYENQYGNGYLYGFLDKKQTQGYMYMSSTVAKPEDSDFSAPMVLTVGADKKLESLETFFSMWVVSVKNNKVEKRLADRFAFTPETVITFVEKVEDDKKDDATSDDKKDDATSGDNAAKTSRAMSSVASSSIKVVDVMPRSFEFTEDCIWIPAK